MERLKEILLISYTVGIKQMVVCMNKIDYLNIEESQKRFEQCMKEMLTLFKRVGYKEENLTFVPCSSFYGDNLAEKSEKIPWYDGPTLVQAIENLKEPKR